jgi:hypothetical protein
MNEVVFPEKLYKEAMNICNLLKAKPLGKKLTMEAT